MYSDRPGKVRVAFYMDEHEHEQLVRNAEMAGLTKSEYLRNMALKGSVIVFDMKTINDLIYEINKIGVNINQIARKVNEFDTIHKSDVIMLRQEYEELCHMLNLYLFDQPLTEV